MHMNYWVEFPNIIECSSVTIVLKQENPAGKKLITATPDSGKSDHEFLIMNSGGIWSNDHTRIWSNDHTWQPQFFIKNLRKNQFAGQAGSPESRSAFFKHDESVRLDCSEFMLFFPLKFRKMKLQSKSRSWSTAELPLYKWRSGPITVPRIPALFPSHFQIPGVLQLAYDSRKLKSKRMTPVRSASPEPLFLFH